MPSGEFFEIPHRIPPTRTGPEKRPPWLQPPEDVVAALVPLRKILTRTDRLTVVLTHIDAFPTGASLRIRIMGRHSPTMSDADFRQMHETVSGHHRFAQLSRTSPEFLRIGVQFPDGRKATNVDYDFEHLNWSAPRPEPSLVDHGSGGSSTDWHFVWGRALWLWPLPPPEPFDLVIEWPVFAIPVTRTSIDGIAIVTAAQASESAWLES